MKTKRVHSALSVLICALAIGASQAAADATDPKFYGKTIGEWSGQWWNWVVAFPFIDLPTVQEGVIDCSPGQPEGKVWFLSGTRNNNLLQERTCTVPKTKALFFPVINVAGWGPEDCTSGATPAECIAELQGFLRTYYNVVELVCELDGKACTNENLLMREQSPPFTLRIPGESYLVERGLTPGDRFPAIADGFWVMLPPLSPGEHVLEIKGARWLPTAEGSVCEVNGLIVPECRTRGFTTLVRYNLTVK